MYTHQERSFTLPLFKIMHIHLLSIHQPEEEIFTLPSLTLTLCISMHHFNIHQEEILLHLYLPSFKFLYIHHFEYPPRGNFYFSYIYPHFKFRYNLSTCIHPSRGNFPLFTLIHVHPPFLIHVCTNAHFLLPFYLHVYPPRKKKIRQIINFPNPSPPFLFSPHTSTTCYWPCLGIYSSTTLIHLCTKIIPPVLYLVC